MYDLTTSKPETKKPSAGKGEASKLKASILSAFEIPHHEGDYECMLWEFGRHPIKEHHIEVSGRGDKASLYLKLDNSSLVTSTVVRHQSLQKCVLEASLLFKKEVASLTGFGGNFAIDYQPPGAGSFTVAVKVEISDLEDNLDKVQFIAFLMNHHTELVRR